jgi:hypothetical protein
MSKNHNNIPLHCSICPKNPRFSDVSHLLTHTSSKAHLSNYFKLKIRAASEISAKVQLDKFEDWYANHDLERLLSDRLASKDQKKAAKDRKTKPKTMVEVMPSSQPFTFANIFSHPKSRRRMTLFLTMNRTWRPCFELPSHACICGPPYLIPT